jgi:hypothetical protein
MAWIKVTDPEGHPVYVCVEQMIRLRLNVVVAPSPSSAGSHAQASPKPGEWATVQSIIDLTNGVQAVQETQDQILALIEDADDQSGKRLAKAQA